MSAATEGTVGQAQAGTLRPGTVTFLFTDIEGSTRLLQELGPERYGTVLDVHRRLIGSACNAEDGRVFGAEGDALFMAYDSAVRAVAGAAIAQRALASYAWPQGTELRVRMAVHTGEPIPTADGNYVGLDLHRVARLLSAGHGAQVLVSETTRTLVEHSLPDDLSLRDLGEHRLKDLSRPERIWQLVIEGLPSQFESLRSLDAVRNNLPTQLTSFIGRRREVAEAGRLLAANRLLTLTGPGGTGKTRLSLQVAAEVADQFRDGAFFVPLEPITDPALVPSTIAATLGVQDSSNRPALERLVDYLKDRQVLLVLDNFEQVLDGAPAVGEILRASPGSKAIATSRAPLRVYGEQEFAVPPLGLPPLASAGVEALTQYEGVTLFIERALAVRSDFQVTNSNAPAVAMICSRLDGLPLAIELAAARIRLLPPEAILERLEHRLSLPGSGGARDLPARQQTLRGAIAWSHDLLDEPGKRLFARCGVFVGGFGLAEAELVCGPAEELGTDVLDGLAALSDQSLLRQDDVGGQPRFRMLETIREFAVEQLASGGEETEIRRRHTQAYLALVQAAEPELLGKGQTRWLDVLEREHDNIRAALTWAFEAGDATTAVAIASAFWRFWHMRGHLAEGAARTATLLQMPEVSIDPELLLRALTAAGGVVYWQGDLPKAASYYDQALDIARRIDDPERLADALYNSIWPYLVDRADVDKAAARAAEALEAFRGLSDEAGIAKSLWALGNIHRLREENGAAVPVLEEAADRFRRLEDHFNLAWSLHTLGLVYFHLDDMTTAARYWRESLETFAAARDVSGIAMGFDNHASLATRAGEHIRALRLAGASSAMTSASGAGLRSIINAMEGRGAQLEAVSAEDAERAVADGQALTTDEAIGYALEGTWPERLTRPQPDAN
jgi:predicted ATPase/class 3 adenylate cyclase